MILQPRRDITKFVYFVDWHLCTIEQEEGWLGGGEGGPSGSRSSDQRPPSRCGEVDQRNQGLGSSVEND